MPVPECQANVNQAQKFHHNISRNRRVRFSCLFTRSFADLLQEVRPRFDEQALVLKKTALFPQILYSGVNADKLSGRSPIQRLQVAWCSREKFSPEGDTIELRPERWSRLIKPLPRVYSACHWLITDEKKTYRHIRSQVIVTLRRAARMETSEWSTQFYSVSGRMSSGSAR
jgi:hypothetical protein